MRWKSVSALLAVVASLLLGGLSAAHAQCAPLPYTISNGQAADATPVMANFAALFNCIGAPAPNLQVSGSGGGVVSVQNPSATSNYNFNLPATAGPAGSLLASGGGGTNAETWTPIGTSGHVLPFLDGSNAWSGAQTFGTVIGAVSTQTGASYTLAATDCGTTILFTSASAVTLTTLNSLPVGCSIAIEQSAAGQVTIAAGSGATQHSSHNYTKTVGQYAILGLFVDTNVGGADANVIITGDGA
jgi:hypothetical protein